MHTVRQLFDHEFPKYTEHLLALDDHSRMLRFAHPVKDETIVKFVNEMTAVPERHKLFVVEDDKLRVIAVGHIGLDGEKMELAMSVLPEHQGQGLGSAVMKRCLEWCQNRGISNGFMVCLPSNQVIKHLALKHGMKLQSQYGETTANVVLPDPSAYSLLGEVAATQLATFDYAAKSVVKFAHTLLTYAYLPVK